MEALLERERKVENWNDDRMDELSRRMDAGFDQAATKAEVGEIKRRFDDVDKEFDKVGREFGRVNDRLDKLFYIQILFLISFSAALITHSV